ncbi:unnamed protein product [Schistosoma curassoni]|uniref:Uncharacterized protein n=1 Tax=Schistosoma curassoni TaxID=6186 RepID=A0A183KQG3_9TREM|nr:unnamed protein product [Schistosoma curassoni]
MVVGDQRLVHTPFVPSGYWSPCAPLFWNQGFPTPLDGFSISTNPVKAPDIRLSSSQFRKQHRRHEKVVSRTFLTEAICAWPCESIWRGRVDSPHFRPYQGIDQRLVHTPFVPSGYWSPCAPLFWNQGFPTPLDGFSISTNPVKAPDIRLSSSQFRKQHRRHEKVVSRTFLTEAICAWPCESIWRGRVDSPHFRPYQGIWGQDCVAVNDN